jgi:hypothetical protein
MILDRGHHRGWLPLGVGEGGLADGRHAGRKRFSRDADLAERLGAQGGQPQDFLLVVVGDQDGVDGVLRRFAASSLTIELV